jgi:hypothetical protein
LGGGIKMLKTFVAVLIISALPAMPGMAATVDSFPVPTVVSQPTSSPNYIKYGTVSFGDPQQFPWVIGDYLGVDPSDSDGDGNIQNSWFNPTGLDGEILIGLKAGTQDVRLAWSGCIEPTATSQHWVGLAPPNPAFTGLPLSQIQPYMGTDIGFSTVFLQPGRLTIYRAITSQTWTPIDLAIASPDPQTGAFCGNFELLRVGSEVVAKFNGAEVYRGPSQTVGSNLTAYSQVYDSRITITAWQFDTDYGNPATCFQAFDPLERLEVRGGKPGAADWEWGLGKNTQSASLMSNIKSINWVNGQPIEFLLSLDGVGGQLTLFDTMTNAQLAQTAYSGAAGAIRTGNAIKLHAKQSSGMPATTRVKAEITAVNGVPPGNPQFVETLGNGLFDEESLVFAAGPIAGVLSVRGKLTLYWVGATVPSGSRLNVMLNPGLAACSS